LTFPDEEPFEVPPCGILINAKPIEEVVNKNSGLTFVRTKFQPDPESEKNLSRIETLYPGAIVIGSILAAQAFPGRVKAMVPVPPDQKIMRADKFTIF
jgi:hypothetical protein